MRRFQHFANQIRRKISGQAGERDRAIGVWPSGPIDRYLSDTRGVRKIDGAQRIVPAVSFGADTGVESEPVHLLCGDLACRYVVDELLQHALLRSEERRVGKECRSRW